MNIAIIGAGFYGCSIALELSKDFPDSNIDLYDKNKDIFHGAASNNQHRVHKGFHYPRSNETIDQILSTYSSFKDKYADFILPAKENYYLIEKTSKISLEDYINKYKEYGLYFREIDNFEIEPFVNTELIEGGISNDEEVLDLKKAYEYFKQKLSTQKNINLKLKTNVEEVRDGLIDETKYDYIINCTYDNPNLGIYSDDKRFNLKYEICIIPVVENFFKENLCITIMDGPFVSAYQNGLGDLTLSSVLFTPYFKTKFHGEFYSKLKRDYSYKDIILKQHTRNLLNHCHKYFKNMEGIELKNLYLSAKVKLGEDIDDLRTTSVVKDGNVISLMCGKISYITEAYNLVKREINGN
jgi:hypothetical protein